MIEIPDAGIRLYRGMTRRHRPELVEALSFGQGVNFTDCPRIALLYAQGARGTVIVVDAPRDARITHEMWPNADGARRLMLWGRFEEHVVAVIPAKELRALVRKKGVVSSSNAYKAGILRKAIDEIVAARGGDVDG